MGAYIAFLRIQPKKLLMLCFSILLMLLFLTFTSNSFTLTIRLIDFPERLKFHTANKCLDFFQRPPLLYNVNQKQQPSLSFNCSLYKYIDELGLGLLKTGHKSTEIVIVTAVSHSFRQHVFRFIHSIRQFYRNLKIIVYDLGLHSRTRHKLSNLCGVEVRFFNYRKYPARMKEKGEFRWKPIIIAEVLNEFGSIWYMDSSIVLIKGGYLEETEKLAACSQHKSFHCTKAPILLHSFTGHGIFAATDQYVYKYFPPQMEHFKTKRARMYESGLLYWSRDEKSAMKVLKWWVLCALDTDCMRNHSTVQHCEFSETDPWSTFGKCHRFDQSVLNLLLFNAYGEDSTAYFSGLTTFFEIQREVADLKIMDLRNFSDVCPFALTE